MEPEQVFNIKLIPMEERYFSGVFEVYRQCEDFLSLGPQPVASMEMVLKDIQASLTKNGVYYGIFLDESEMIGILDLIPREVENIVEAVYIELFMITPQHRQRGIGTQILRVIEANIKNKTGVNQILASAQINNPRALSFWQRNGYVIFGGPELQPDLTTVYHMKKDLGPLQE